MTDPKPPPTLPTPEDPPELPPVEIAPLNPGAPVALPRALRGDEHPVPGVPDQVEEPDENGSGADDESKNGRGAEPEDREFHEGGTLEAPEVPQPLEEAFPVERPPVNPDRYSEPLSAHANFDPGNWYWLADDGRLWGAKSRALVEKRSTDPDYQAFTAAGNRASGWPRDEAKKQTDASLEAVLSAYGLSMAPPTP